MAMTKPHWSTTLAPWPKERPQHVIIEHDTDGMIYVCDVYGNRLLGFYATAISKKPSSAKELASR